MKVFERPGPVNTADVINILIESMDDYDHLVVASVTGESAVKIAETIKNKKNSLCNMSSGNVVGS